jgi:hypothetical protein
MVGRTYFYYKIKFILEDNPQIKNIFLSYHYASFAKRRDAAFSDPKKALNF